MAEGFFPDPDASRTVADPNWTPTIFEDESRDSVTGRSFMFPAPVPPSTIIRSDIRETRTAAGLA